VFISIKHTEFARVSKSAARSGPNWAFLTMAGAACGAGFAPDAAHAEQAVQFSAVYTGDVMSSWSDAVNGRARYLDSTSFTLDLNLAELTGLTGGPIVHADLNITSGASANDDIGTLQGVDNIESGRERTRIYELWAEQGFFDGKFSVRVGFQEINSEFNATDSAGMLLNASFGLTPELSGTGSNGPSTYPSTAPSLRLFAAVNESVDVLAAAFNADALGIGDPGGPDYALNNGALLVSQVNWRGPAAFSLGAWGYTQPQPDVHDTDLAGDPIGRDARGLYAAVEKNIWKGAEQAATAFLRAGVSDGRTSDFTGSFQAGVLFERPIASRPDSHAAIGIATAFTSDGFQDNARASGFDPADHETAFEFTYSDNLFPWLTVQPDLQLTFNPGGDKDADMGVTAGLRITIQPWSSE
jgi:porin